MTKKVQVFLLNSTVSQQSMVLLTQLYVRYSVCQSDKSFNSFLSSEIAIIVYNETVNIEIICHFMHD
jgi:hypothetical protein